jgi:phosphoribosylformimino-5-aminoimidazole carboxamide ribotide isomerase
VQIYPAVDIKGGRVARALEGEDARDTFYGSDPLAQAGEFVSQGARWLHVVDMDRALQTGRDNSAAIDAIAALKGVEIQLGGNICSEAWVRDAVATGASRIVLGTAAALTPDLFRTLVRRVGAKRCGLAIDTRNGAVVLRGSTEVPTRKVEDLVLMARDEGVTTIIYRDIERDGTAHGADVRGAGRVAALDVDVIVAGGVAGLSDVHAARSAGLAGVIVGRALYEGSFSLREALQCCS